MKIKLSIITVCYNSEETIEETIKSVIAQKDEDIEYIIVDGKSTDKTLNIINRYKTKIDVIISEKDKGISDAFNKGIRIARGEWIGLINSDDIYLPDAFLNLKSFAEENVDVFYGNGIRSYGHNEYKAYLAFPNYNRLHECMCLVHPATFIKKDAYEKYGMFNLNYKAVMDRELLLRMLNNGAKFQYNNKFYAVYSMGGESDKHFFRNVLPEDEKINITDGMNKYKARIKTMKAALIYILVKFRNSCGLNKTNGSIEEVIKEQKW